MNDFSILYAFDENYAPWAGVSMYSLFENNKDLEDLTIYCVVDNVSKPTLRKLLQQAALFGRKLTFVDATAIIQRIKELNIPMYRGSYTTNFRLFFHMFVKKECKRLLYIDCDTLITGSLRPLAELDMGDKVIGVVRDSLSIQYKELLGLKPEDLYFNAGVSLINIPAWNEQKITEKMLDHIQNVQARYCNPDQDLLNLVLQGRAYILPPNYNLQPHHLAFTDETYFEVYKPAVYYTAAELEDARANPVIFHIYRYLGDFPWHKGNLHPANALFDQYAKRSLWKDIVKKPSNGGMIFKMEKVLYKMLPRKAFLCVFREITLRKFRRQNAALQKEQSQ
ncbi:MAG: glycosyltransferase family 8 protein [Ruminococcaceae bacterium]|nr:glycosyltransferase family 8 protein [Oscillospiraceae bacterium]